MFVATGDRGTGPFVNLAELSGEGNESVRVDPTAIGGVSIFGAAGEN